MAINLKFDLMGNPEPPSIVLATRSGNKLGQLNVKTDSIDVIDKFNDASEFSFTLNKYVDGELTPLWDKVVDFKLVYCPQWDLWFEIRVELDEATETVKTVFCTQLGQAELSQIKLYDVHINEEGDPNWDVNSQSYKSTILYDENDASISLLNRLLKDKAPHYSIRYVSPTIARIQRTFSFDDISIYDAFQEIAEEIGCLFVFHSNSGEDGKIQRTISVYDLQQKCNDCGYRGEFTDKCPECNSTNIINGYGDDTLIFVTSDELATEGIQLTTDTDSVKNCFKLKAGDDLMTATVRNCNPNGTDYIWYFSDAVKEDMSDELVGKIESYDELYRDYYDNHESTLDATLVSKYNALVNKYKDYYNTSSTCLNCGHEGDFYDKCSECENENILTGRNLQTIPTSIEGYSALMNTYYNVIDLGLYLKSGLMPSIEMSETTAEEQIKLLDSVSLSPVAVNVKDVNRITTETANSAVLSMAKVIIKPTYKVEIKNPDITTLTPNDKGTKTWKGKFVVTNYSDEEDTAESGEISVEVNNDNETFVKQKIDKALKKANTDDYSISGLFEKDYNAFCAELKKYALNPLQSFYDACQTCLSILTEQGVKTDTNSDLYKNLYAPYNNKSDAIAKEIAVRQSELNTITGKYDIDGNLEVDGLQQSIESCRNDIQEALNFETYLGEDLWLEFCLYRREDTYSNDNYISDGLNNAELFDKALEFFKVAENEIYKSAELQHSISTTLNNLLGIEKFKPLVDSFKVGNWIRVQIDDKVFKLRLLECKFGYGDVENISVEFSDITKIKNGITDIQDVISQASSMATSYSSVKKQADQGSIAQGTIEQWITNGLDAANTQIKNNNAEEITITSSGLLGRSYDSISGTYSDEQIKLTHNILAYTDNNWETVKQAIGKHTYTKWENNKWVENVDGYGSTSDFVTAGYITGSQIIGGEIVSYNYKPRKQGTYINLVDGEFEFAGGKIVYDTNDNALTLKGVTIQWDSTNAPEITNISGLSKYVDQLEDLEDKVDGRIQTYSQSEDPSTSWTNEEKSNHIGDLWLNPDDGLTKRWTGTEWVEVTDSDLKELAESKAQIFTSTPTPPYYVGDLWVQGESGEIMRCMTERTTGSYTATDWEKASKYTDDTLASEALEAAKQGIADAATGINLANTAQSTAEQAETNAKKYADSQVSNLDSYVAKYLGLGGNTIVGEDFVISPYLGGGYLNITNTDNNSRVIIDPNNLTKNDYIFQVHNGDKVTVGVKTSGDTEFSGKVTATSGYIGNWELSSTYLVNYSGEQDAEGYYPNGFGMQIASESVVNSLSIGRISRDDWGKADFRVTKEGKLYATNAEIKGGSLLIGDKNSDAYAEITNEGILSCSGANITGKIHAEAGGTIGRFEIGDSSIYNTKTSYDDTENDGVYLGINGIGLGKGKFYVDSTGRMFAENGRIGGFDIRSTNIALGKTTYNDDNNGVYLGINGIGLGQRKFYVTRKGYLYASDAEITGTIYATDGEFTGTVNANQGNIGAFEITNDGLSSNYITLNSQSIYFPTQASFNLANYVSIFHDNEQNVSYIATTGDRDFEIKNMGGAGIRFEADKENEKVTQTITIAGSKVSGSSMYSFAVYLNYTVSNNGTLLMPYETMIYYKIGSDIKSLSVTIPAGSNSGTCSSHITYPGGIYKEYGGISLTSTGTFGLSVSVETVNVNTTNNILYSLGSFCPNVPVDGSNVTNYLLGDDSHVWASVRAQTASITSSDSRLKNNIIHISEEYERFFDGLNPVSFKYNDGSSNRRHLGFIAQDVEASLNNAGITTQDFAGLCIGNDADHTYALRYEEFIPLNTFEIQKLKARTTELEDYVEKLEERIAKLENK